MAELRALTEPQLRKLYREHVAEDFPPAERRPLSAILRLRRRGDYDTWGVFEGETLLAYAFLWRGESCALLDYLAVCRDARGQGYGTRALELVKGQYGPMPLLAEVEAPEAGAAPEENALRQRRLHFYQRAGFAPLDYQAVLFGVRYAMLAWPAADARKGERLQTAHRILYQSEVPPLIFRRVIHIPAGGPPQQERTDSDEYSGL